jgi:hypothetical protein
VIINPDETGTVSAAFENPSDREVLRTVRAHISHGFSSLIREVEERFTLEPGTTEELTWEVTAEDAAWGHFILVRIHVLRNAPLPAQTGSCGVMVVDLLGLPGGVVVYLPFAIGVLTMAGGVALWIAGRRPGGSRLPDLTLPMTGLGIVLLIAMITSALGVWMLAGLLTLLALILAVSVATWAVTRAS